MKKRFLSGAAVLLCLLCMPVWAQQLNVDSIKIDAQKWGFRTVTFEVTNENPDSALINVHIRTTTPDNYLSRAITLYSDSSFVVTGESQGDFGVPLEWPAAFGKVESKVAVDWKIYGLPDSVGNGSTESVVGAFMRSRIQAYDYTDMKYSLGPLAGVAEYSFLDFEYPRMQLYLLGRKVELNEIQLLFAPPRDYDAELIERCRAINLYPFDGYEYMPALAAMSEKEGYNLQPILGKAGAEFAKWMADKGQKELGKIFKKSGIGEDTTAAPLLEMLTLMSALLDNYANDVYKPADYTLAAMDQYRLTAPRWIVQGGDFFMPKLSLLAVFDVDNLNITALARKASDKTEVEVVSDAARIFETGEGDFRKIKAEDLRTAISEFRGDKQFKKLSESINEAVEESFGKIEAIDPLQKPFLAEYVIRKILGDYFFDTWKTENGSFKIGYES